MKKKKGFTLVELLAVLAILAILVSVVLGIYFYNKGDVDNTVSEVLYNNIIDAGKLYYSEFKNKFVWHRNEDGSETSCIDLNDLIDTGFFPNNNSEFNNIKNEKVILINRVNGVNTYSLEEYEECVFLEYDIGDVVNDVTNYNISDNDLGGN